MKFGKPAWARSSEFDREHWHNVIMSSVMHIWGDKRPDVDNILTQAELLWTISTNKTVAQKQEAILDLILDCFHKYSVSIHNNPVDRSSSVSAGHRALL